MKTILTAVLATLLFVSCGSSKKIFKTKESNKKTEKTKETSNDSTSTETKTLPTESELVYDLNDLSKNVGDFIQKMNSGNGNETEIKKEGSKIYIKNKTGGSKDSKVNVNKTEKESIYDYEYHSTQVKKIIKKIPWIYWLYLILFLIVYYRKNVFSFLSYIFPVMKGWKIVSLILGSNNKT